jgi:hypothetical protein
MFSRAVVAWMVVILVLGTSIGAQDTASTVPAEPRPTEIAINKSTTLQIFFFGDLLATFQDESEGNTFDIGQAEVDIESELADRFTMALAIAYDEGVFSIGAFTADYSLWSAGETSPAVMGIKNVTIGGGQYDVPFGIDYHVYPSIDRKLVSCPLVVENTHDCWNDYGVYASAEATWGNAVFFVANGFAHEGHDLEGEEIETRNELAVGGRFGISPHESIEVGGSVAGVQGLDGTHDMLLAGADIQFSVEDFELKGEYIAHKFNAQAGDDFTNDGYYVQGLYNIGSWYLVARYGEFRPAQESADIARFSGGIGHSINEIIELRLEYQAIKAADDAAVFQVAFGF